MRMCTHSSASDGFSLCVLQRVFIVVLSSHKLHIPVYPCLYSYIITPV